MTLLLQNKEPTMALYLTTRYISHLSRLEEEGIDQGKLERRGLIEDEEGES